MKEMWETPRIAVEKFAANEYVAACWDVGCTTGQKGSNMAYGHTDEHQQQGSDFNNSFNNNNHGQSTSSDGVHNGCGWIENQYIYDAYTDENGVIWYGMNEVNVSGQNDLACTIYSDNTYTNGRQYVSGLENGQTLYWTTHNDSYTWFHYGIVSFFNSLHPNRS